MDREQAKRLIIKTFENPFDKSKFTGFINNLLKTYDRTKTFTYQGNYIPDAFKNYISSLERIGQYTYDDKEIDLLIVYLKRATSLERARTMQRNCIAWYLKGSRGGKLKDAALLAFVSPDSEDWRFSLVKMDYRFEETSTGRVKVREEFTPARRWSFLVGKNEKSHTAQSRFLPILENDNLRPTLEDLEEAFNVEVVTQEFFQKYRELFIRTKLILDKIVKRDAKVKQEFELKNINAVEFAKKLLGQIVFLYFLQKKGWFGVEKGKAWGTGPKDFIRRLFDSKYGKYINFYNDILEPLFYEALRTDRSSADHYYSKFNCKIPFLNGGLFDPISDLDWVNIDINLPNDLFSNSERTNEGDIGDGILDVLDRYNFTVHEEEPLEKEVALDPELLGKIYEKLNAIRLDNFDEYVRVLKSGKKGEETKFNKEYGVYYTPREIVHYMCKESLINYLESSTGIPACDIEKFVKLADSIQENEVVALEREEKIRSGKQKTTRYESQIPKSIKEKVEKIDKLLAEIKICDPAVGSGAFPIGMMHEIIKLRLLLSVYLGNGAKEYDLKRHCIENSLYGVDIDPGAVEICKLRFWLSLVVDEDDFYNIKPLPNLDYKVVCGDSLLGVEKDLFNQEAFNKLEELKPKYFNETNPLKKQQLKNEIDKLIFEITKGHKEFDFEVYFSEVFHEKGGFDVIIANPPYIDSERMVNQGLSEIRKKITLTYEFAKGNWDIYIAFFEKGLKILNSRVGVLTYITQDKWLSKPYGKYLRKGTLNKLKMITNAGRDVFEDVNVDAVIALYSSADSDAVKVGKIIDKKVEFLREVQKFILKEPYNFDILFAANLSILLKIDSMHTNLSDIYICDNACATSDAYELATLLKELEEEFDKRKYYKVINTGTIGRYYSKWGVNEIQYLGKKYKRPVVSKVAFYKKFKNKSYSKKGDIHKIIVKGLTLLEACIDFGETIPGKSTLIISSKNNSVDDLKFILGIIHSKLVFYYIRNKYPSSSYNQGINFTKYMFSNLPIPQNNYIRKEVISLVNQILSLTQSEDYLQNSQKQAKVEELEKEIDRLVYKLYRLTDEEIKSVEEDGL